MHYVLGVAANHAVTPRTKGQCEAGGCKLGKVVWGYMGYFIDRRLNGKNKSMVNRQRFYAAISRKLNNRLPMPSTNGR